MNNISNTSLRGQAFACRDFQASDRKQFIPDILEEVKEELKDPTNLIKSDSQTRILCLLHNVFPKSLKTLEISEAIHLHRSTVSAATSVLAEMGLIEKSVISGTENRINPTLSFCIAEKYREFVSAAVNRWSDSDPTIFHEPDAVVDEKEFAEPIIAEDSSQTSPIDKLTLVITKMAKEIKSLRCRVSTLESRLDETHKQNENFDLSEAFDALGLELGEEK